MRSSLAVDRMSNRQLYKRLKQDILELQLWYGGGRGGRRPTPLTEEMLMIVRELEMRGTQLELVMGG